MTIETNTIDQEALRRRLYDVVDDEELSLSEKQRRALEIGRRFLDVDCGRIQRERDDSEGHEIVVSVGDAPESLEEGTTIDRTTTYCRRTLEAGSTVAFTDAETEGWASDPAYRTHGLRCYLGTPLTVHDEVYGTVCFNDSRAREEDFRTAEKLFVELIARLLGREMEADRYERTISETGRARVSSERKYQTLLETAPNAILLADATTGEITDVNEKATELTGYSRSALEQMRVFDIHPEEDHEKYAKLFAGDPGTVTRSRFDDGSNLYVRRADGSDVPVEISASKVELADRTVIQGILRDVSGRQRRERELERNQEFLRQTQEAVDLGGWELDFSTGDLRCTDEIFRIYGLPLDYDLSFDEALTYFHPDDEDRVADAYERLVRDAEPFDIEARIRTADREDRWVRVIGGPVHDDDGEVVGYRGVTKDITERRERVSDLRVKTRAIEEASVGVFIAETGTETGPSGCRLVYVNGEFERLTGYDEAEVKGRSYRFFEGPSTDASIADEVHDALETGDSQRTRLRHRRADGTSFWSELTVTPVRDETGEEISHCVGFLRDITPMKRREALVGVLNRVLRHNLRNDMNVVGGYARTIADRATPDHAELASQIEATANDLVALSEKARTLEDTMAETVSPELRDVATDVRAAAEELQAAYPETEVVTDVPETCRAVATERFQRALRELGENAAKHAGDSAVTFAVKTADDGRIAVYVEDSGPGLSQIEREVVETGRETPMGHGQGLGLWLVNWIVTGAGGTLSVDVDDGTTVSIRLHPGDAVTESKPAEYYRQAALGTRST